MHLEASDSWGVLGQAALDFNIHNLAAMGNGRYYKRSQIVYRASCAKFALKTNITTAASFVKYHLLMVNETSFLGALNVQGIIPGNSLADFLSSEAILGRCSHLGCNLEQGLWHTLHGLIPEETYFLLLLLSLEGDAAHRSSLEAVQVVVAMQEFGHGKL